MKTIARLAAFCLVVPAFAGCTNGLRHHDHGTRDPVRLPAAPSLDSSVTNPAPPPPPPPPIMSGEAPSPLSSTQPARSPSTR